jgi:hypothetical protein
MQRDQRINLLYWIAAAALAVALMPLADLLHDINEAGKWGVFTVGMVAALGCFLRALFLAWVDEEKAPKQERPRKMIALIGMVIFGFGFLSCAAWFFWPQRTEAPKAATIEQPKSLADFFKEDFPNFMKMNHALTLGLERKGLPTAKIDVNIAVYMDFASKTKFYGVYVSHSDVTYNFCVLFPGWYKDQFNALQSGLLTIAKDPADSGPTDGRDLTFSGRLYLYTEDDLSLSEKAFLENSYKNSDPPLSVIFRGHDYAITRWLQLQATKKH